MTRHLAIAMIGLALLVWTDSQAEQQKEGSPGQHSSAQLPAAAISGWLMGNSAADTKAEGARRLWSARQFVLKYQQTHNVKTRQEMLKEYESRKSDAEARIADGTAPPCASRTTILGIA